MRFRIAIPPRIRRFISGLGAFGVCATGTYFLVSALDAHYPVREWLVWRLAPLWGYTLLLNAACVSMGAFALRRLLGERELPPLQRLLQSMMLGLTLFVLALYLAGTLSLFRPWLAVALPVVFLAVGFRDARRMLAAFSQPSDAPPPSPWARLAAVLAAGAGAVALAFMYLEALDTIAINFDAAWYHMPTAQDYARHGHIVPFPGESHRAYPHLTSMVQTWAFLVPGLAVKQQHWMLALHLEYAIVLWRIIGVAALCQWLLDGRLPRGLWAAFFLFPSIFVYDQSIGGSADHFLGFYSAPIVLAATRALPAFDKRFAALLGIAIGGHVLVKYQSLYLLVAVSLAVVGRLGFLLVREWLKQREGKPAASRAQLKAWGLGAGVVFAALLLVSSPHFVKNSIFYGNPAYPLLQSVFPWSHPKAPPGYYDEASPPGAFESGLTGLRKQRWIARQLFKYPLKTANRKLTDHRPYMGALFSLLIPCAVLVAGKQRLAFVLGFAVAAFWVWAQIEANDRYLLSFYDLFIAIALALMVRVWETGLIARLGLVPLVALQLIWGGDAMLFYGRERLTPALDLIGAGYTKKYDNQRFPTTSEMQVTQATPPDARILARNHKGILGLERDVLSDVRDSQDYISYSHLKDERELYELLKSRGVTHLLYPHGQRAPARWNNTILWDELYLRHGQRPQRFGPLHLAEMPGAAPASSKPYLVLVVGVEGEYPDGVYRVEQLDVDAYWPELFTPKPKPLRKVVRGASLTKWQDLRAVVLGNTQPEAAPGQLEPPAPVLVPPPKLVSGEFQKEFELAEGFRESTLYLRRRKD